MRYALLWAARVGELLLLLSVLTVLYFSSAKGISVPLLFILWLAWRQWKNDGGLVLWRRCDVKEYLRNAKELGL